MTIDAGPRSAAFAAAIAVLAGCGMSQSVYRALAEEVEQRNEERYRRAEAELREKGYTFADDATMYATLFEGGLERCRDAWHAHVMNATALGGAEMFVRVAAMGANPGAPLDIRAAPKDACYFFGEMADKLEGRLRDGRPVTLSRIRDGVRLASDGLGGFALVTVWRRVLWKRRVLVDRWCNRTPTLEQGPFEIGAGTYVALTWTPPPTILITVPQEALDVECTRTSW